ncbi:MAG: site-2 protease family protein [Proteobacteria bacterium]|nr:site-2 protease family protein [Pseudomonadota bacterium]
MDQLTTIQKIAIWILPILFAVTLHEAAHGYVAYKLGDDTAHRLGRITANPLKHIDLIGTIILPLILMLTSPFIFGWAKPVPVNPNRLRHPKRDFALVALAGPTSNFLMAVIWIAILKLCLLLPKSPYLVPLIYMSQAGLLINVLLMVLNLIPIPPLDGSRFISYLLPTPWDKRFDKMTPFGILIILALIFTGVLGQIMYPVINFVQKGLIALFHIT